MYTYCQILADSSSLYDRLLPWQPQVREFLLLLKFWFFSIHHTTQLDGQAH